MAWVKLDDAMPHHPKVMAAGAQAFALDVAGIAYSNRFGTDGFIGSDQLPAVLPCLSSPRKWVAKLVQVGRWIEVDGGWEIHDVDDYQPSAADQEAEREKARERMRKVRDRKRSSGEQTPNSDEGVRANGVRSSDTPSRPVPTKKNVGARKRATQLPDGWAPTPAHADLARELGVNLNAERSQFADFHTAKGSTFKDWDAAFRTWLRNAVKFGGAKQAPSTSDGLVM